MSSESGCSAKINPEDTIKILVATDIHLGYNFNKKRGQESDDSFITFEEILQYGKEYEVDLILLGGDLFHNAKPTQPVMVKCMELLRRYCLGPKKLLEFWSDSESISQHCASKTINYGDSNFNIGMPIFSIHGKHDDPSFGGVGSMDLLSASGLINYFGKYTDLTHIAIPPLIFKKGSTHLAVYGLSYINDIKLSRMLRDSKIEFLHSNNLQDFFNLFVFHQNRASHLVHGHISEAKLPHFLDFILWGCEHECRITPEFISEKEYYICQPGSSVATSLCEGEAKAKHIGLLNINGKKLKMKKLKLKTVRPFVFDNLILDDSEIQNDENLSLSESVFNYVDNYIENKMIPKAVEQLSGHPKQPLLPLIRLKIFHTKDEEVFDPFRLAQKYCEQVANSLEMVVFRKERSSGKRSSSKFDGISDDLQNMADVFDYTEEYRESNKTVQERLKRYFNLEENKNLLTVLTVDGLNEALTQFIDRGNVDAFNSLASHQMKKFVSHLETSEAKETDDSIKEEIISFRNKIEEKAEEEDIEIRTLFANTSVKPADNDEVKDVCGADEAEKSDNVLSKRGRGRGRGITARGRGARNKSKESDQRSVGVATKRSFTTTKKQTKTQDQALSGFIIREINRNKLEIISDSNSD